jgi:hypothetical protein
MIIDEKTGLRIMTKEEFEELRDEWYVRGIERGKFIQAFEFKFAKEEKNDSR